MRKDGARDRSLSATGTRPELTRVLFRKIKGKKKEKYIREDLLVQILLLSARSTDAPSASSSPRRGAQQLSVHRPWGDDSHTAKQRLL